jgi:hypothetical protein
MLICQTHAHKPYTSGLSYQYNRVATSSGFGGGLHYLKTSGADETDCSAGGRYDYRLCRTADITNYRQHLRLCWCECQFGRCKLTSRSCSQVSCNGYYTGITQVQWHLRG